MRFGLVVDYVLICDVNKNTPCQDMYVLITVDPLSNLDFIIEMSPFRGHSIVSNVITLVTIGKIQHL